MDQFIEDVINMGIPRTEIVRLGSSAKASLSVRDLSMKDATSQVKLTREQCDILDWLKQKARNEEESLQQAFSGLEQQSPSKDDILEHLEFRDEGPRFFSAFAVPKRNDGIVYTGTKGKAIDSNFYLLDRWCRGQDATPFATEARATSNSVLHSSMHGLTELLEHYTGGLNTSFCGRGDFSSCTVLDITITLASTSLDEGNG